MTLRLLAGVALLAGGATYLVKRYRKQLESAGTAVAAEAAAQPTVSRRPPPERKTVTTAPVPDVDPAPAAAI